MDKTEPKVRYRCDLCGNITRFDIVESMTVKSFYHYGIDGELNKEDPVTIHRVIESVSCRWCNSPKNVKEVQEGQDLGEDQTTEHPAES